MELEPDLQIVLQEVQIAFRISQPFFFILSLSLPVRLCKWAPVRADGPRGGAARRSRQRRWQTP